MAHFGLLMVEAMGHLLSVGALAGELRRRGHTVTLVTCGGIAEAAGRLGIPIAMMPPEARRRLRMPPPPLFLVCRGLLGRDLLARWFRFPGRTRMHLEFSPAVVRELGVDLLLVDQQVLAGGSVAEHLGLPFVTICSALHEIGEPDVPPATTGWRYAKGAWPRWRNRVGYAAWEWYVRPSMRIINRFRRGWRLPPLTEFRQIYSPLASICQTCPELDYPRTSLPDTFHYAGALAADRTGDGPDFPWERLDGRPLVFVSLGTIGSNRRIGRFRLIAKACSDLGVQVVITGGEWCERERARGLGGSLPGDPLVLPFVPQLALLDRASLVVGHAGLNTVLESLTRGVPLVVMPQAGDQFGTAGRIEYAGVGVRVRSRQATASGIRDAITRVLHEASFGRAARRMQEALLATGGAAHAADIVERACETRRPVLRSQTSH